MSLQPCKIPVITPDGFLYDKEAILEYFIAKKNEASRKLKEYEKQKKKGESELAANEVLTKAAEVNKFVKQESEITKATASSSKSMDDHSISNMANGKDKHVPSYWIPSKTPEAKPTLLTKPDKTIYCPMSGKPLRIKDLIPVKFTEINDPDDKRSLVTKDARYMCPITRDTLGNSVPAAVIKPTGDVRKTDRERYHTSSKGSNWIFKHKCKSTGKRIPTSTASLDPLLGSSSCLLRVDGVQHHRFRITFKWLF
ncbi:unnamed protein product [Allacma fusca]|uniref:Nitric oxide synthase-interacting protein zinc-finger domain-containing protein n=1 Tax=Allacma fusca TaxID=39272 RepID=A0A8J2K9B5_9HEXA|nr:unnamed protein product [Allacma fusca]